MNGRLALVRAAAGEPAGVYTMNPDGSDLRLLAADSNNPAWSPDGRTIAFDQRLADGSRQVFVVPATGGPATQVTADQRNGNHPTWSPDGTELAYVNFDDDLVVVPAAGGTGRVVADTDCLNQAAWTSDGTLYFTRCEGPFSEWDVWRVPAAGGAPERVTATPAAPEMYLDVSPDGRTLAVSAPSLGGSPAQLWLMGTDGGAPRLAYEGGQVGQPAFSPDGTQVAFGGDYSLVYNDRSTRTTVLDVTSGTVRQMGSVGQGEQQYAHSWQALPAGAGPAPGGTTPADTTPPAITVAAPAEGATYAVGQAVPAQFECTDGSGATCEAFNSGTPIQPGELLWTRTTITGDLRVRALDGVGNLARLTVHYRVQAPPGAAAQFASAGDPVTTDPGGSGATTSVPVQTTITTARQSSGIFTISPRSTATAPPAGYSLLGTEVVLEGPSASAQDPHLVTFALDGSLTQGAAAGTIAVLRNGVVVPDCTDPGTAAAPDPCVASRLPGVGDDVAVIVRTSAFSTWSFGTVSAVPAGSACATVCGGETVSTGSTATADVPLQTSITVPSGVTGQLTVTPVATTTAAPAGYGLFGKELVIDGPAATAGAPYTATFTVDSSLLAGVAPADVQVFRNGVAVADCADPAAVAATPDPCVARRAAATDGSGDAVVTVRTAHFSRWSLGKLVYALTGPLSPVYAAPTVNVVKPGTTVPVRFKLGGDRGLDVLRGTPTTTAGSCGAGAQKAVPTLNNTATRLVYEPTTQSYVYLWQTSKTWKGCRDLVLRLRDGTTLRTLYNLK